VAEVLGILASPAQTVGAVERVKRAGFDDVEVYSPVPSHEIEEAVDRGPSWVRLWTLVGGLTGVTLGYLFTIWTSYDWPLVIGGKPYASIPAYTVIAFELTILFGGVLTVLGLLTHGLALTAGSHPVYRPTFTTDQFGCLVRCHSDQIPRVQELLRAAGCTEVRVVEG
jgi:molybdopterin-containing oxidoreductase family membrane subunit